MINGTLYQEAMTTMKTETNTKARRVAEKIKREPWRIDSRIAKRAGVDGLGEFARAWNAARKVR